MATELIINASLPETRIALMESGEIQDMIIERAGDRGIVGNIYKGRVTRVLPGMQAAFVDIGLEKAAFLYVDDVHEHEGLVEDDTEESAHAEHESREAQSEDAQPDAHSAAQDEDGAGDEGAPEEGGQEEGGQEGADHDEDGEHDEPSSKSEAMTDDEPEEMSAQEGDGDGEGVVAEGGSSSNDAAASEGTAGDKRGGRGGGGRGGRRWGRNRRGGRSGSSQGSGLPSRSGAETQRNAEAQASEVQPADAPENYSAQVADTGHTASDRSEVTETGETTVRHELHREENPMRQKSEIDFNRSRGSLKQQRGRDRKVSNFTNKRGYDRYSERRPNIQDLLKEGQEVLVQVSKDPIATKGARLTCHISLPGRHLVCMPTINHVGISRRIERDEERRKLREYVIRGRQMLGYDKMGFIVRTASGGKDPEKWIRQDVDYLGKLWSEIRSRVAGAPAPSLVYADLNVVIRAVRDWVSEDVDKIIVDSRYYYDELKYFADQFMPSISNKIEMYQGDIPVFDAYGISSELNRALERRVWLKSGGYIVIDQAEAMVCIDVNTGRFVGKKNLEDTILKTNLEAVEEIAYQLRLRNCGGIIIIDLIDMEKEENRRRVYRALELALRKDRARPTVIRMSDLGLIEMTRKRTRDTMIRILCQQCNHCEGRGFLKSARTVTYEILREIERVGIERDVKKILVQAHPDVIDALATEERSTLDQLENRTNKQVFLQAVVDFHSEQFEVMGDKSLQPFEVSFRSARQAIFRDQQKAKRQRVVQRDDRDASRSDGRNEEGHDGEVSAETSTSSPVELPPLTPHSVQRDPSFLTNRGGGGQGHHRGHDRNRDRHRDRDRDRGRDRDRDRHRGPSPVQAQAAPLVQPGIQPRPQRNADDANEDNIGNRISDPVIDTAAMPPANALQPNSNAGGFEDEMSEEDRIAYLRAQSVQDAALSGAPVGKGGYGKSGGMSHHRGGGGGGGGRDRNRDRGGRDRNRGRGGRGFGGGNGGGHGGGGNRNRFRDRGPSQGQPLAAADRETFKNDGES